MTLYWYGGTGNWSEFLTHWSGNSGNSPPSPVLNAPTSSDDVIIDSNSGFGSGGTISLDDDYEINNITANEIGDAFSILCLEGKTFTINGTPILKGTATKLITLNAYAA
jgi:hypothetical protein